MDKTKVTKRKGSNTKTDNGSAEVFVIPPNLLERLGINLGNIGSASEITTESQVTDSNIISKDKDARGNTFTPKKETNTCVTTSSKIESSIIETAKLMKKSVFLSPTFISQNTSVIQGEIEIAGNVEPEGLQNEVAVSLMGNEFSDKKIAEVSLDMQIEYESDVNVNKQNCSPIVLSTQETEECDQIANVSTLHDVQMQIVCDDHPDEAYSSDGSNSNIGCTANTGFNKSNKNKINIISEQIIDSSQFYKLKNSYSSPENSFIHVPINTMITSHNKKSSYHENVLNMDLNPKFTTIVKPIDITFPNECNMNDQTCVKGHPICTVKCDTNSVLNEVSSEIIIIDQNQEDPQQDTEILQMFLKQDAFLKDKDAVSNIAVPCHADTVDGSNIINKGGLDFPSNSDHNDDKVKRLTVMDTDVDGNKDKSFVSKILPYETKSELIDNSIATSCVTEPEKESPTAVYCLEDKNCSMKNNMPSSAHQESLLNIKEFETIVQINVNLQKCEPDFIYQEKEKTPKKEKQANHSLTKDLSVSQSVDNSQDQSVLAVGVQKNIDINNAKSSHQYNQDSKKCKVYPVIEASTENHNSKEQGPRKNDTKYKQKDIPEHGELKRKVPSNENYYENNYADNVLKAPVIVEDKVREIAKYLSKFADMHKRNQFRDRHGAVSSTTLSNKKHVTNSKSSIQGVEKPGGSVNKQISNGPPIHTYERTRQERCKSIPAFVKSMCADSHTHAQSIDVIDIHSFDNVSKEMELCLCDDFGRLTSYDGENIYEHIHFWDNARSDGTPDMIFSIYNEDDHTGTMDKYVKSNKEAYPSDRTSDRKLCWHEMKLTHENKFDYFDNDCNNKGNEAKKKNTHDGEKHNPSKADLENVANDKCNKRQNTENEPVYKNKTTANLIQNHKEPQSNKIYTDELTTKPGKKRKCSIESDDNDDSPAKKYGSLFEQLPRTEQGRDYIHKDQSTNNYKKDASCEVISEVKKEVTHVNDEFVKCGVCEESIQNTDWSDHIASRHDYLAWKIGEPSLDVNDEFAVREHLYEIAKASGGLTCAKCGLTRKYVKTYLNHIRRCSGWNESQNDVNVSSEIISKVEPESLNSNAVIENDAELANTSLIKCGVCEESVETKDWSNHIGSRHDYLAWKDGDSPLDVNDEAAVKGHLYELTKKNGGLTCAKCGLVRKYVKAYLSHIKSCNGLNESQNSSTYNVSSDITTGAELDAIVNDIKVANEEVVSNVLWKCGVCDQSIQEEDWNSHMSSQHGYLAWKYGDSPLDVNDEMAVKEHLNEITKMYGGLTCVKCGIIKKTVKAYLNHVKHCNGLNESRNDSVCNISTDTTFGIEPVEFPKVSDFNSESVQEHPHTKVSLLQCGVCQEIVQEKEWHSHIGSQHDYLAWKLGEPALDVNDEAAVREHLYELTKKYGGLMCGKCGLARKYVKAYLNHIKKCNGLHESQNDSACYLSRDGVSEMELGESANSATSTASPKHGTLVKCAVCAAYLLENDWNDHRASNHNYLAWKCGVQCLDIADDDAVRNHLYSITTAGGLRCATSDITDVYVKSYIDHVKFSHGPNVTTTVSDADLVKCGVCGQYMVNDDWKSHLAKNHEYLAWKDGEPPFDVDDEEETRVHLQNLAKKIGGLSCPKCGLQRKYAKSYLHHIRTCDGVQEGANDDDRHAELNHPEIEETRSKKCGVCNQVIEESSLWIKHLSEEHNYLAWKDGDTPLDLDDAEEVYQHLYNLSKELGGLICKYCGKIRKYVKSYLEHIKNCNQSAENDVDESRVQLQKLAKKIKNLCCPKCGMQRKYVKSYLSHLCKCGDDQDDIGEDIKCGACNQVVNSCFWAKHLSDAHDYLAWKDGDTPPDFNDQEQVNQHLYDLSKIFGGLTCKYCSKTRKYVKSYLEHIKCCKDNIKEESEVFSANSTLDFDDSVVDFASGGICAVCQKEVTAGKWIQHTQKEHNYLAWREGEEPWNIEDFADVNQYLYVICKKMDGLTCNKCGIVRKYVKSYLSHIKTCNVTDFNFDSSVAEGIGPVNKDLYQCAMCKEHIKPKDWNTHAMKKHYNVTWIIGQTPIDIKNPYAVEKYLKDYKQVYGTLKCNMCGTKRASFSGFYAHIITCGKSEEEIDMFRSVCEICNNKYLCIYKNQHAMIHRVQSYNAELKTKIAETKEEVSLSGKRRAAVKARSVIEKYSDNMSKHAHTCKSCGYGTDFKEELETHKCDVSNGKDFSGDESSAAELGSSDDESPDSDVDSNISNEVNDAVEAEGDDDDESQPKKRIRLRENAPVLSKVVRIPFKVEDPNSYIIKGDEDFCKTHLTDEVLYPRWRCKHEAVIEHDLPRYLPPLEHSCKVKLGSDDWITLKRFGAKRDTTATTIFVGASIVSISWAPLRVEDIDNGHNFLAIACHNGADCPRYQGDETPSHENLIQIWNYAISKELPKLALGIAHDFGTVWSMDWCPSGARDAVSEDPKVTCRLGLLAVACSSGSAYIFSVPHPSTVVKNNEFVYKLKPVAELRMTMCSDRKRYQATSVSWSKQKGHTIILVGYADGSTAFYDLHTKSPLLCMMENNVAVFYPYHDERPHNTCITGTDLYPVSSDDATGCGAGAWVAPTGAQLATRAGAAGASGRARLHVASLGVEFAPHTGSAVLAGDDAIMHTAISELVWVPPGRRLGPIRSLAGCARCGRVVASMPPTLRVMRPHPAYYDLKKQVVGMLEMTHLAQKRKKQVNDELAMTLEPLTYADAVSKYGLEFKTVSRSDKVMQHQCAAKPKAHCPERFPLADVKSMAFCPSRKLHDKLAVATHAGILFLMTLS